MGWLRWIGGCLRSLLGIVRCGRGGGSTTSLTNTWGNKKYVVYPGFVQSRHDGDVHYITARQLMHLYGVRLSDCVVAQSDTDLLGRDFTGLIPLRPRYDGDYRLNG